MALTEFSFYEPEYGADLHVVRDVPPIRLDQRFRIRDDDATASSVRADTPPPHIDVRFHPHFEPESPPGLEFVSGHGVRVHTGLASTPGFAGTHGTGEITVEPPPPGGRRLRNFLLTALATDRVASKMLTRTIRVHVHDAITRAWMTPSTLTVHRGGKLCKLSLLAEFDDKVIGDISNWAPTTLWSVSVLPPGDPDDIEMYNMGTGLVRGHKAGVEGTVTVDYPGLTWPTPAPTGRVKCVESWATPHELTWVAGKDPAKWQEAPNLLFLPDGFVKTEAGLFKTLVQHIVRKLWRSPLARPFDLIYPAMNFWTAFVPSFESGLTILHEMSTEPEGGGLVGRPMPVSRAPAPAAPAQQAWSIEELIHEVGLPIEADVGRELHGSGGLLEDWQSVYGPAVTEARVAEAWKDWRKLAGRKLVNERDTLFGLARGVRPRVEWEERRFRDVARSLHFNDPARASPGDLDQLLANLRYKGEPVGETWRWPPDSLLPPTWEGKDRHLVCILSRTRMTGGIQFDGYYISPLAKRPGHRVQPSAAGGFDILPVRITRKRDPIPPGEKDQPFVEVDNPVMEGVLIVAHETGHAFNLGDEYGERANPEHKDLPERDSGRRPDLSKAGNVQDLDSLKPSDTSKVDADRIKWGSWHRIEKAGVLAENVAPGSDGVFKLVLLPGHASMFKKDDLVRLRKRPLVPDTLVSDVLRVTDTPAVNQAHVETKVLYEGWASPIRFRAGSILMKMVRLGTNFGDELKLMADIIRQHIDVTGLPLNAPRGRSLSACDLDDAGLQEALNLPDGLPKCRPKLRSRIVGLYEGGGTYHCGVYHPTGSCIMRDEGLEMTAGPLLPFGAWRTLVPFCPICRYLLVDSFDPTKHGIIDREYAKIYPDPRL